MSPDLLSASTDRPLAAMMRADLELVQQTWRGRLCWVVKDPLAIRYYRFEDEEISILRRLDGRTSLRALQERFEQDFAPQRISFAEMLGFISHLHQCGLIVAAAENQGDALLRRKRESDFRQRLAWLANPLSIRFRGVNPDRFLDAFVRLSGWLFSPLGFVLAFLFAGSALLLAASQWEELLARLPSFQEFFAVSNWLYLAVALAGTKVVHELGHGVACKYFGARCHELGVMLLLGTPCLYCNVSDSWMIPSKWRRAMIGAAGMYVELLLASLCLWLWWFTQPGLLHALSLNVVFVCSVSTLLFNANPLMRYDGYFILADLLEIPNLRQKSETLLRRAFQCYILGARPAPEPFLPAQRQGFYAAFGAASTLYGAVVTISILWFLTKVLEPYGAQVLGQLAALLIGGGMLFAALRGGRKWLIPSGGRKTMNHSRAAIGLIGLGGAAALLLLIPYPHYVICTALVEPAGAEAVYVEAPGVLKRVGRSAGPVQLGEPLAELENPDARLALERARGECAKLSARLESLQRQSLQDEAAFAAIAHTQEALTAAQSQLLERENEFAKLVITAPKEGIFLPTAARPRASSHAPTLASWSGRPLAEENLGAYLPEGTLLGRIGTSDLREGQLLLSQDAIEFIRTGLKTEFFPTAFPGERWQGRITHVGSQEVDSPPPALEEQHGGEIRVRVDPTGRRRTDGVYYVATVEFDQPSIRWLAAGVGKAKIHAGYRSLGSHLWRLAVQTFRLGT
jgi:putative peptide zinc metalloprotease protein